MSKPTKTGNTENQSRDRLKYSTEQASKVFEQVDKRLQDLGDRVLPKQPYLISLPSDVPYRRHVNDPHVWHSGTPFSRDEEQLQYMSFLPKDGEEEELLKAEGEWADDAGNMLTWDSSPQTDYPSRPDTPAENTSQRKKISLKDYKIKDKSSVNTPERIAPADSVQTDHKDNNQSIPTEGAVKMDKTKDLSPPSLKSGDTSTRDKASHLRDRPENGKDDRAGTSQTDLRSVKRRKLSHRSSSSDEEVPLKQSQSDAQQSKPLPNLLSPSMPSQEKRKQQRQLPGLLSPNLPPGLDKAVSALPRTEDVKSILKAGIGSPLHSERKSGESPLKDLPTGRVRSDSHLSAKASSSSISKLQSPSLKPASNANSKAPTPAASPRPRQRHTIVLKYGKKNRKRVEMLLKFHPRPKKAPPTSIDEPSNLAKEAKSDLPGQDKKRATEQVSEQIAKKQKTSAPREPPPKADRPSTPLSQAVSRSPPIPTSHMKSAFSTPKKEFKSAAMQRVASTDTTEARTPSGDLHKTSTPSASSHLPKASPGPSLNPIKAEDKAAWVEMNEKYFAIGRSLKREGSKLANDGGSSKDHSLSVVLLIEALLCFMINSGAQAQARPNVDPGWSTIIPYHIMVFKQSRRHRHLHGLVVQLGAVCRQSVQNEDMKRLAREPIPDDQSASAPTPGSDGTAKATDDPERYKKRYLEFRDGLVQNARELQTAWLDGSRLLSLDLLEHEYPKTWKQRSRDTSKRQPDKLNPKALSKNFYLPLDMTTTVFEATNFALAFLKEWTDIERIIWEPKIQL